MKNKPVNAVAGKQGFQKTGRSERGKTAPTSADTPPVTAQGADDTAPPYGDQHRAMTQRASTVTQQAVARRATAYQTLDTAATQPLTPTERQQLEQACLGSAQVRYSDTPDTVAPSTKEALDLAQSSPRVGAVVRRCFLTEDGQLRPDVDGGNYTDVMLEMNATFADEASRHPADRHLQRLAALVHGTSEYINDRDSSGGFPTYADGGTYPDLDRYVSNELGTSLHNTTNPRLQEALAVGHWGPNSG